MEKPVRAHIDLDDMIVSDDEQVKVDVSAEYFDKQPGDQSLVDSEQLEE